MRIIHGKWKGFQFPVYSGSNTRPTTDLVKESLFNSLHSFLEIEGAKILDLFAGTGNIGLECLSRGAASLTSVDHMQSNTAYMLGIKKSLQILNWEIVKSDVLKFMKNRSGEYDLIFADPPYDYPNIHDLVDTILSDPNFTSGKTLFVLEHVDRLVFNHKEVFLKKQYGNTSFTCFRSKTNLSV